MSARILQGDCLDLMREMPSDSFDSIVTDPPAGIGFMGAAWDGDKGGRRQWTAWLTEVLAEALRVVKPGGHALVWALPRTSHWTGWAAEEAGWESRDILHHCFWSGMPKGGSIGPHIDRLAGATREVVGTAQRRGREGRTSYQSAGAGSIYGAASESTGGVPVTAPATPDAAKWEGWHSHLKPSIEHWHLFRKPLNAVGIQAILEEGTTLLEAILWHIATAKLVALVSTSTRADSSGAESGSARWFVALLNTLRSVEWSEVTATCRSPEEASTLLSIASSWLRILDVCLSPENTSTTSMETALITALKTLRSSTSRLMPATITQAETSPSGLWLPARAAATSLSETSWRWGSTPKPTADASATSLLSGLVLDAFASAVEGGSMPLHVNRESTAGRHVIGITAGGLAEAVEHWHLLRKPLSESSIARNVLKWGTGALNIDGCRIAQGSDIWPGPQDGAAGTHCSNRDASGKCMGHKNAGQSTSGETFHGPNTTPAGRYPANLVHFKKPSPAEKARGREGIDTKHPTPKSVDQMRYLCRLVTPPDGHILDCFGGSGSTGVAAKLEGFDVTLCEMDEDFCDLIRARIKYAAPGQEVEGGTDPEPVAGHQPSLF